MLVFVFDKHSLAVEVGEFLNDTEIWDAPLEGEAHGTLVGVLLSANAAVAVGAAMSVNVEVVLGAIIAAGDVHIEPELESLLVALGQQQPLGVATRAARCDLHFGVTRHSLISLSDQFAEGGAVRDDYVGVVATAADVVSAGLN